jgi:AraC-like DNA-binding protein
MKDQIQYHRVADNADLILSEGFYSEFEFKPHYHLDYHIGMVVDGLQKQRFQGKEVLLGPGRISIMPPGEIHDGHGYDDNQYCMRTFRIAPALLTDYFTNITEHELTQTSDAFFAGAMLEDPKLANRLQQLFSGIQHPEGLSALPVEEAWINVFDPLFQQLKIVTPQLITGGLSFAHLNRVREYAATNLSHKISLKQLADLCDLSRYQFLRRFEHSMGLTPHNWLIQLRLEQACLLLRQPGQNLAQVAANVGFYDQSHFNRAFRTWYGITPSQY